MTHEEITKFQKRARYVAIKRGYPELSDDFAQEVLLTFVEQPHRASTIDQLFIDYLRGTYGDTRTPSGRQRSLAERSYTSLDEPMGEEEGSVSLHDIIGSPHEHSESESTHRNSLVLFSGRKAEIYQAYFIEEMSEKSIGNAMNLTESRISQLLKPMKKEIRDYFILREGLERMEWDENFTKLSIDWIRL